MLQYQQTYKILQQTRIDNLSVEKLMAEFIEVVGVITEETLDLPIRQYELIIVSLVLVLWNNNILIGKAEADTQKEAQLHRALLEEIMTYNFKHLEKGIGDFEAYQLEFLELYKQRISFYDKCIKNDPYLQLASIGGAIGWYEKRGYQFKSVMTNCFLIHLVGIGTESVSFDAARAASCTTKILDRLTVNIFHEMISIHLLRGHPIVPPVKRKNICFNSYSL
jgi:hypothetical protein